MGQARKHARRSLLLAVTFTLSSCLASLAHAQAFSADAVKAAFLYRFVSYVEWPETVGEEPFVIAIVGAEDVAKNLDGLLPSMTLQGRRAAVRRVTRPTQLDGVRVLYVGPEMLARTRDLRAAAIERPILLVTEGDQDFASGGVINFLVSSNKVRFEVSLTAAERAHLRIDSALLGVAARVDREPRAWLPGIEPFIGRASEAAYLAPRAMLDTALERLN